MPTGSMLIRGLTATSAASSRAARVTGDSASLGLRRAAFAQLLQGLGGRAIQRPLFPGRLEQPCKAGSGRRVVPYELRAPLLAGHPVPDRSGELAIRVRRPDVGGAIAP